MSGESIKWASFVFLPLSHMNPWSGVVLNYIDSQILPSYFAKDAKSKLKAYWKYGHTESHVKNSK